MALSLFTAHPLAFQTAYSELKRLAGEQTAILIGTPGSVSTREVKGQPFLYRQFYDAMGKKAAEYIGPAGDPGAAKHAAALRERIDSANAVIAEARVLARQGYARADGRTGAIVAALANHGVFRAGALLIGSHAYGVLLNELGVKAAPYLTEDIDVARPAPLHLERPGETFEQMLADSTVPLSPVPGFDRKTPPTSYKIAGRDRLRVDLLVPSDKTQVGTRSVPELRAHAAALPQLRYLLGEPLDAVLLARECVVAVKVPRPERFAWHKMFVAQSRTTTSEKKDKDILQAAVLVAVLAEKEPDGLRDALRAIPRTARTKVGRGAARVRSLLEKSSHVRAVEVLQEL